MIPPVDQAEIVILGAGVAGCALATLLARQGRDVLLLDRKATPDDRCGESLLPFGNRMLEVLGLSMQGFMRKDGAAFLMPGKCVRFSFAESARPIWTHAWQVRRGPFESQMRQIAINAGARLRITQVRDIDMPGTVHTSDGPIACERFVDAGGVHQFLGRKLGLRERHPNRQCMSQYGIFEGIERPDDVPEGDILITPFDGGWCWFIPFIDGAHSVGAVVTAKSGLKGPSALARAVERSPEAAKLLRTATRIGALAGIADFAATVSKLHGDGWVVVGDAAVFLDPVLSSGVLLALEWADELAKAFADGDFDRYEANVRAVSKRFELAVNTFYDGSLVQVIRSPESLQNEAVRKAIVSMLAGDVFDDTFTAPIRVFQRMPQLAERLGLLGS